MEDKAQGLVAALKERGMSLTTAESLTGGRIAAAITAVPGSSQVFPGGVVSYCDRIKHQVLGVPQALLERWGAVSEPVARAMAQGAAQVMGADVAVSATGLAGPEGDGSETPVGTVYLGLWIRGETFCRRYVFSGDRSGVQNQAVAGALELALWGLNHYGPSVGDTLGLDVREYSKRDLVAATAYYAAQANEYASRVGRDADGLTVYPDFSSLAAQAGAGYDALAQQSDAFTGGLGSVKPLAAWQLFSRTGTTGIFVCLTAEACVNPDTYTVWIPFTMCHELAHRQAVAAEDEANFCAYLACMASGNDDFGYSGAFGAYIYCHNALSAVDRQAASEIWSTLSDSVAADVRAANEHYAQYEGKVQDAAQKVNDTYLKAFSEESGVQSYGEAADLLIAWYLKNNA